MNKILLVITIIVSFIIGWSFKGMIDNPSITYGDTITSVTIYNDTTIYTVNNINTKKLETIYVEKPIEIDTSAILQAYYNKYTYSSFINDTNVSISINDTVSQNSIVGRSINYKINKSNTIITKNINNYIKKNGFFIGVSTTTDLNKINSFTPSFIYTNKKRSAISAGYDLLNKNIFAGIYYKIEKK